MQITESYDDTAQEQVKNQAQAVAIKLRQRDGNDGNVEVWAGRNHVRIMFQDDAYVVIPDGETVDYIHKTEQGTTFVGLEP